MADELKPQEDGDDTYLDDIHKAFGKDNEDGKRIGQVWKLSQQGLDAPKIAEELSYSKEYMYKCKQYIKQLRMVPCRTLQRVLESANRLCEVS